MFYILSLTELATEKFFKVPDKTGGRAVAGSSLAGTMSKRQWFAGKHHDITEISQRLPPLDYLLAAIIS